jgi:hypothetical protein
MKVLGRKVLDRPIILGAGDRFVMSYVEVDGVVRTERVTAFAVIMPSRAITVDEAVLIEAEIDGKYAVGGLLLERSREAAEAEQRMPSAARLRELRDAAIAQVTIKGRKW